MGIFSKIGDALSDLWDGIKKVFEPVLKPVGKLLETGIGKAIMLGVSVFTMGSALLAGGKAFLGAEGFLGKFVAGGQEFMNSLLGTEFGQNGPGANATTGAEAGKSAAEQTAEGVAAQQKQTAADMVQGGVDNAVPGAMQGGGKVMNTPNSLTQGGNMAQPGAPGAPPAGAGAPEGLLKQGSKMFSEANQGGIYDMASKSMGMGQEPAENWLSKAASAAMDFAKSDGGGNILGKAVEGVGNYYNTKDQQRYDDRIRREFRNPDDPYLRQLNNFDYSVDVPDNLAGRASEAVPRAGNMSRPNPSVPFRRQPYPAGR